MNKGTCAVAVIRNQVVLVQAARTHEIRDGYIEVVQYTPFAHGTFLASAAAPARIPASDLLSILPGTHGGEMLQLPGAAYAEFLDLASRNRRSLERQYTSLAGTPAPQGSSSIKSFQRRGSKFAFWRRA